LNVQLFKIAMKGDVFMFILKGILRIIAAATLLSFILTAMCACRTTADTEPLVEMQMVYEDNPAFFFKDMKLVWDAKEYYIANSHNPEHGREIGYAADGYSGWRIYELKGYGRDYLMAIDNDNEDCRRVMSINPPEKPWRQYVLENATDRQRAERMLSVTLYKNGTASLSTPPISSYAMTGTYYYSFEDDELLIYQNKEDVIARFIVPDDNTLVFSSATVPLFANAEARYLKITDNE